MVWADLFIILLLWEEIWQALLSFMVEEADSRNWCQMEPSLDAAQDNLRAFSTLSFSTLFNTPPHAHLFPRAALFGEAASSLAKTVSPIHDDSIRQYHSG